MRLLKTIPVGIPHVWRICHALNVKQIGIGHKLHNALICIYIYYLYIYLFISCLSWQLKLCKVNTSKNSRVHTAEDFGLEAAPYVYKITNVKSSKQALRHPDSMQAIQHRSSNTSPSPPKPLKLFARLPL